MADITKAAASIRPLNGAVTRRGNAGATLVPGEAVYLDGTNGWKPADADAVDSAQARGVVIANGNGAVSFESGERVDIVVSGPIEGYEGMTPGANVFISTTAGALDQTAPAAAGDFPCAIGYAESATVLFVQPQSNVPVVNQ